MQRTLRVRRFQALVAASCLWASACSGRVHSPVDKLGLTQPVTPLPPTTAPAPALPSAPAPPPTRAPSPSLLPLIILLGPAELADGTRKEEATAVYAEPHTLASKLKSDIEEALVRCAEKARLEVMTKYFGDRRATQKECNEKIGEDGITRAQKMGNEYEEATLDCLRNESPLLKRLAEHGHALSIEPTYRRNPSTGNVEHVPDKMVETLLRNRQHEQLLGSIKPDIVVHPAGFPNRIQAVYDFKFSCMGYRGAWRRYTKGPHQKRSQGEVYEEFLGIKPKIIDPPNGTIP